MCVEGSGFNRAATKPPTPHAAIVQYSVGAVVMRAMIAQPIKMNIITKSPL